MNQEQYIAKFESLSAPAIGDAVTYKQFGTPKGAADLSCPAVVTAVHSKVCVDLSVTIDGELVPRLTVMRDTVIVEGRPYWVPG